jgi:hypothetical protein
VGCVAQLTRIRGVPRLKGRPDGYHDEAPADT